MMMEDNRSSDIDEDDLRQPVEMPNREGPLLLQNSVRSNSKQQLFVNRLYQLSQQHVAEVMDNDIVVKQPVPPSSIPPRATKKRVVSPNPSNSNSSGVRPQKKKPMLSLEEVATIFGCDAGFASLCTPIEDSKEQTRPNPATQRLSSVPTVISIQKLARRTKSDESLERNLQALEHENNGSVSSTVILENIRNWSQLQEQEAGGGGAELCSLTSSIPTRFSHDLL